MIHQRFLKPFATAPSTPTRLAGATRRVVLGLAWISIGLWAPNTANADRDHHATHTHGVAELTLAKENGELEIQFESPAINVLGFEHKPTTKAQNDAIKDALALLSSSSNAVLFNKDSSGKACEPVSAPVSLDGPAGDSELEHTHDHEEKHGDSNHESKAAHSEISVLYRFSCQDAQSLNSMTVILFEHFPGLEKINANWVTETQQGQAVLTPTSPTIALN